MARVTLTKQTVARAGLAPTYTTISSDNAQVINDGNLFLHAKNTHTVAVDLTLITGQTYDGLALADRTVSLAAADAAGDEKFIGPFQTNIYNADDGYLQIDASVADKVEIAALTYDKVS